MFFVLIFCSKRKWVYQFWLLLLFYRWQQVKVKSYLFSAFSFIICFVQKLLDSPILAKIPTPEAYLAGTDFFWFCSVVSGKTPISFEWRKNSELLIVKSGKYKIQNQEKHSLLSIPKIELSEAGLYTCSASNQFGSDNYSIKVIVKGRRNSLV